jgi:hypothetical protein
VGSYLSSAEDGVQIDLKKKTADAPEMLDEAAKKAKQVSQRQRESEREREREAHGGRDAETEG